MKDNSDDISVTFAKNFIDAGGTIFYCYNEADIAARVKEIQQLNNNEVIGCASDNLYSFLGHFGVDNRCVCDISQRQPLGAILCEALLANNGSVVISSNQGVGSTVTALSDTTIVLAFTSQVVTNWEIANERIKSLYDQFPDCLIVTNPSSQAYRKGLQKIYLILIEDETN